MEIITRNKCAYKNNCIDIYLYLFFIKIKVIYETEYK